MPITVEELHDRIDEEASTKADLEDALHEHADHYDGLAEITAEDTRAEMLEQAEEAISAGLTKEGKSAALSNVIDNRPEAVLMLRSQSFLRLDHPRREESFTMSVFGNELGSEPVEDLDETPDGDYGQIDVDVTPLEKVPEWAYANIYDLALDGTVDIFDTAAEAQKAANDIATAAADQPIVDDPSQTPGLDTFEVDQPGDNVEFETRASADFTRPEQKAAWAVLNKTTRSGERPLPEQRSQIASDPADLHPAEASLVRQRIKRCIEDPTDFEQTADADSFDVRVYLDQLLELEMRGYNAPRPGDGNTEIGGVTRPAVLRTIRSLAEQFGYEVVGQHVRPAPQSTDQILPEGSMDPQSAGNRPDIETSGLGESINTDDQFDRA